MIKHDRTLISQNPCSIFQIYSKKGFILHLGFFLWFQLQYLLHLFKKETKLTNNICYRVWNQRKDIAVKALHGFKLILDFLKPLTTIPIFLTGLDRGYWIYKQVFINVSQVLLSGSNLSFKTWEPVTSILFLESYNGSHIFKDQTLQHFFQILERRLNLFMFFWHFILSKMYILAFNLVRLCPFMSINLCGVW